MSLEGIQIGDVACSNKAKMQKPKEVSEEFLESVKRAFHARTAFQIDALVKILEAEVKKKQALARSLSCKLKRKQKENDSKKAESARLLKESLQRTNKAEKVVAENKEALLVLESELEKCQRMRWH